MEILRKIFPISFAKERDTGSLIIIILVYWAYAVAAAVIAMLFSYVPIVKIIIGVISVSIAVYGIAGISFSLLNHFKVGAFKYE